MRPSFTGFMGVLLFSLLTTSGFAQPKTDSFLTTLFSGQPNAVFQKVIQHPDRYRLQIIYTQIDRDRQNNPSFRHYYFNVDSTSYFNPASTVKLPLALLSLEKINWLKAKGITRSTPMQFDSAHSGQTREWTDPTAQNGYPSVEHLIKKALLVSENDPYSRMYEFVGQQAINQSLHAKGYPETRITRRFVRMTAEENRHTNPIRFLRPDGSVLYAQPAAYNPDAFDFSRVARIGRGYLNAKDSLIQQPFDFTTHNRLPLESLHRMLQTTMFPLSVLPQERFALTESDYTFLYQYLSQFPGETNYPKYDGSQYYDSFVKFFFRDSSHQQLPPNVRVFNKVGWAYGFLTDASYVVDFANSVEYMLSATIYVNADEILNDNRYEYEQIGHPFLYQLGQTIYAHERQRKRPHKPDLSRFRINYEKRQNDARPLVKDVDN